jgi:hypothetical protein
MFSNMKPLCAQNTQMMTLPFDFKRSAGYGRCLIVLLILFSVAKSQTARCPDKDIVTFSRPDFVLVTPIAAKT